MRRLIATGGRLVRMSEGGYRVLHRRSGLYWFPTQAVRGLINRGMVSDEGYLTPAGLAAYERYKE